jgi:4-hydroxy-tetrahydrodipicolinate synthase
VTPIDGSPLETVVAVPPTPFREDGGLDLDGFERIIGRAVEGGLRAITIGGNTGEFASLTPTEIGRLLEVAAPFAGRVALLVGVGGDLATARQLASAAATSGAFGVMVHEPPGPFRSPGGWVRYHAVLADAEPGLAIVPYVRDPAVRPEHIGELVAIAPNVTAVKYAVPDPVRFTDLVTRGPRLTWICGLAESWAPFFWPGGSTGFTSGLAVIEPRLSLELLDHLRAQRTADAMATWRLVRPFEALRARDNGAANVPAIKEALALTSVIGRTVRPPISELSGEDRAQVAAILASWEEAVRSIAR